MMKQFQSEHLSKLGIEPLSTLFMNLFQQYHYQFGHNSSTIILLVFTYTNKITWLFYMSVEQQIKDFSPFMIFNMKT